jgi:lysine-specific demethylase 3
MNSLPMPEYTLRKGKLNLAAYMPDYFLNPELGPKMYIAYGSALYSDKGSTNLHIDMSDAVNCLVYVGLPKDGSAIENTKEVFKEVDKAGGSSFENKQISSNSSQRSCHFINSYI